MSKRRAGIARVGLALGALLAVAASTVAQEGAAPAAEAPGSTLGLAERRALKAYQDGKYPDLLKAMKDAAGFELEVEVKWETIALLGEAESYGDDNYWTKVFFLPLRDAFGKIARDDMGKEALKKGLKKVVIAYDEASAPASNYPNGLAFEGGTLTVNWRPFSNADDVGPRTDAVVATLEPKL